MRRQRVVAAHRCQPSDSNDLSQAASRESPPAYNRRVTDLENLVGERLMFGLAGPKLTDTDVRLFRDTRAAGLILYRRNFETPEQHSRLLDDLESALGRRLLVATDHEGGRIVMLGQATTIFPDNLAVGTAGDEAFAYHQGLFEARELRRLGVDVNFAPVLDVLTERYSPNIGIRSYGKDPSVVTSYGLARIKGMQKGGVSACAKHFPGKGHSPLDAHLRLPTIDSTWAEMQATHLPPFLAAVAEGIDCLMTSHPVYSNLDPTRVPATFSRRIVHDCLREEIRFGGVIVSERRCCERRRPATICCSSATRSQPSAPRRLRSWRRTGRARSRSATSRRRPSVCAVSASAGRPASRVGRPRRSPTPGRSRGQSQRAPSPSWHPGVRSCGAR